MAVTVTLTPGPRSLWDEPVAISVHGLAPNQPVTLRASLRDEKGELFESSAHYQADAGGQLDLRKAPALGGSHRGVEPMGLFRTLQPQKPFERLVKRDVETPFRVDLEVYDGHDSQPSKLLAQVAHERGFLGPGVRRIPVREGSLRATLFLPPGTGPFPGIIDLYGSGGGLCEYRASLLAGHGFAVLALAYFRFEDLPKELNGIHLEYFEEALDYMLQHPEVKGPGIGLLGFSKGGDLCLSMASFLKGITATVLINGCVANTITLLHYKEMTLPDLGNDLGDGPFPGVIDMFGDEGGLHEFRASLLACRGFATLALPYFAFEDLPPIMKDLNLDYFAQAAKFVQNHPKVKGPKIGVIGSGKGAELAFSMATFLPDVAAVVSINGCISNTGTALQCGPVILPGLPFDLDKITVSSSGVYDVKEALVDPLDPAYGDSLIPIEKANSHFLFVVGEDDKQWNSSLYADLAIRRLEEHGKKNYTLLSYPNAGHRIDPPNSPFFPVALDRWLGVPILGGGQCRAHAIAQEESWKKILEFLKMHLK